MAINQDRSVVIFATAYLPLVGGAEVAVDEITKRLPDWQFDLITAKIKPGLKNEERINNVNVYRIGWGHQLDKFLLPLSGFLKAVRLNKKRKYNLIWSLMASQASIGAAFFKIFYPSKKLLLNIQEGDPEDYLKRYVLGLNFLYKILIRPWHLLSFRQADYITVLSRSLRQRVRLSGFKSPIEIVPNGVDLEKFKVNDSPQKNEALRLKLGINQNEKVIIHSGRLAQKNGLDDLVKAMKYLSPFFKLLLMGDGSERGNLENIARELKIENQIIFLGRYENDDLPEYLAIADVFVRPSLSEGLGVSFLEAMACGVPIIGTPVGGIPDLLKDRETGLFCQVKNPKSVAQKIKEILENEPLRKTLAKNGLALVKEKYNWDNIALKMEEVFKEL